MKHWMAVGWCVALLLLASACARWSSGGATAKPVRADWSRPFAVYGIALGDTLAQVAALSSYVEDQARSEWESREAGHPLVHLYLGNERHVVIAEGRVESVVGQELTQDGRAIAGKGDRAGRLREALGQAPVVHYGDSVGDTWVFKQSNIVIVALVFPDVDRHDADNPPIYKITLRRPAETAR